MTSPKHIVFYAPTAWSHVKALLALAARIAQQRPATEVLMTFLAPTPLYSQIQRELALKPGMSERVNVIAFTGSDGNAQEAIQGSLEGQEFYPAFAALWNRQQLWCHSTQRAFRVLPRPTLAILDAMTCSVKAVRAIAGTECAVLAWMPVPAGAILRFFGPEDLGGLGDLEGKIAAEAARCGKSAEEVAMTPYYRQCSGEVVRIPGLPDAYDYETFPQEDLLPVALHIQGIHRCLLAADGAVFAACSSFDGDALPTARQWLASHGQQVWAVGPLEDMSLSSGEVSQSAEEDAKILEFLDSMTQKQGERSVIYMSFGTSFHPKDPTKVFAFVNELLDMSVPFLWSHASPFAKVPEDLAARIDNSTLAHHASWVPQRAVLAHPATMWFVSHGGWNSAQEALGLRVPMALWPLAGDQSINAAVLTLKHAAAFELLSVREGSAAQPALRSERAGIEVDFTVDGVREEARQLLVRIRGDEGARVRTNAEKLAEAMDAGWYQGGEASAQLEDLLRKYID